MDLTDYYESLILLFTNKSNISLDQIDDSFSDLFNLYPKINTITIDEIEECINNVEGENLKLLYRELRYIKEYKIISEKYKKVFSIIKQTKSKKEENQIEGIKNNQDIQSLLNFGEELLESNIHLFYVGLYVSHLYENLNQIDDSIRILNKLLGWYDNSKIMKQYIYHAMIDVYYKNKISVENKLFRDNHNWQTITLYKFGKFSYYHSLLFMFFNAIFFIILWFVIGKYLLFIFLFLLLVNGFCFLASISKKRALLLGVYIQKSLLNIYVFIISTIFYFFVQTIIKL